jgi:hypothetical protein
LQSELEFFLLGLPSLLCDLSFGQLARPPSAVQRVDIAVIVQHAHAFLFLRIAFWLSLRGGVCSVCRFATTRLAVPA